MNILILKLCAVFLVIIAMLWRKLPLFAAISGDVYKRQGLAFPGVRG